MYAFEDRLPSASENWVSHSYFGDIAFHAYPPDRDQPSGTCPVYRVWLESLQCYVYLTQADHVRYGDYEPTPADIVWYAYDQP